jgi:hypothetical protein
VSAAQRLLAAFAFAFALLLLAVAQAATVTVDAGDEYSTVRVKGRQAHAEQIDGGDRAYDLHAPVVEMTQPSANAT